jgi:hypothetical protein
MNNSDPYLITRDEMLRFLRGHYQQMLAEEHDTKGRVIFLAGSPGVGKTSLVTSFKHTLLNEEKKALFVESNCTKGYSTSLRPLMDMGTALVSRGLGIQPDLNIPKSSVLAVAKVIVSGAAQYLMANRYDVIADCTPLFGGVVKHMPGMLESIISQADLSNNPKVQQPLNHLEDLLFDKIQERSAQNPLILFFDEFEHAQEDMLGFIPKLARKVRHANILVIVAYQSNSSNTESMEACFAKSLRYNPACEKKQLAEFTPGELRDYLHWYFRDQACPEGFVEYVRAMTASIPADVEEFCLFLKEEGRAAQDFVEGRRPERTEGMTDVAKALQARIQCLDQETRYLLTCASIEGTTFTEPAAAYVAHLPQSKVTWLLNNPENKHLQIFDGPVHEQQYGISIENYHFSHRNMPEIFLSALQEKERQNYYREAFNYLSEYINSLPGDARLLALDDYARYAHLSGNLLTYVKTLRDIARMNDALYDAPKLLEGSEAGIKGLMEISGVSLPSEGKGVRRRNAAELNAVSTLVKAMVTQANQEMRELCMDLLLFKGRGLELSHARSEAEKYYQLVAILSDKLDNKTRAIRANLRLGYFYHWKYFHGSPSALQSRSTNQYEAQYFDLAYQIATENGDQVDPETRVDAYNGKGFCFRGEKTPKGEPYYWQAVELAQHMHYDRGLATALHGLGAIYYHAGDLQKSEQLFIASLAAKGENKRSPNKRPPFETGNTYCMLGNVYLGSGQVHSAVRCYQMSIHAQKGIDTSHISIPYINLANIMADHAKAQEAFALLNEAAELLFDVPGEEEQLERVLEAMQEICQKLGDEKLVQAWKSRVENQDTTTEKSLP